jgi:hypothetical protein
MDYTGAVCVLETKGSEFRVATVPWRNIGEFEACEYDAGFPICDNNVVTRFFERDEVFTSLGEALSVAYEKLHHVSWNFSDLKICDFALSPF